MLHKRADWSRPLPRSLVIPTVMTLKTLADVRELMRHLPAEHRERPTWRHVAAELEQAAAGADTGRRCRRAAPGADVGERRVPPRVNPRRFPPPYATGQALGYFYFEDEPGRRSPAKLLTPSLATVEGRECDPLRFRCSAIRHLGAQVLAPDRWGRNHRLQFLHWAGRLSSTGLRIC